MKLLLYMKHWQLFLLLFGAPIIFEIILMTTIFPQLFTNSSAQGVAKNVMPLFFTCFFITMIIILSIFFTWFWTIGTNLYTKLLPTASISLKRFKAFLIFPVIYMFAIIGLMAFMASGFNFFAIQGNAGQPDAMQSASIPSIILLIIPLHLFAMFCMFYLLYFVAKTLKAVELQRPVEFGDYAGEFFLLWFFFIGVWVLQPRINRIFAENTVS